MCVSQITATALPRFTVHIIFWLGQLHTTLQPRPPLPPQPPTPYQPPTHQSPYPLYQPPLPHRPLPTAPTPCPLHSTPPPTTPTLPLSDMFVACVNCCKSRADTTTSVYITIDHDESITVTLPSHDCQGPAAPTKVATSVITHPLGLWTFCQASGSQQSTPPSVSGGCQSRPSTSPGYATPTLL